jgi:hypothetical protein
MQRRSTNSASRSVQVIIVIVDSTAGMFSRNVHHHTSVDIIKTGLIARSSEHA